MSTEPMMIEVPGIPGKLRSQTLDEYVGLLIPEHPARQELANIRALALEGMKSTQKLAEALGEIAELKNKLGSVPVPAPLPTAPLGAMEFPPPPHPRTAICPICGKTLQKIGWGPHMKAKHPADYPIPFPST